jgi:hypothetical protein
MAEKKHPLDAGRRHYLGIALVKKAENGELK